MEDYAQLYISACACNARYSACAVASCPVPDKISRPVANQCGPFARPCQRSSPKPPQQARPRHDPPHSAQHEHAVEAPLQVRGDRARLTGEEPSGNCPVTSKIPRPASLTCEEESVLSIFGRQGVRFARFVGRRAASRDNEVCLSGRLGDRFGRFPGCMNMSGVRPWAAGRGKLSGRRRRSSTTNWQKGKFDVIGQKPITARLGRQQAA